MISEREFANSQVEFWRQLLPMSDEYVRARNRQLGRFAPPLKSKLAPDTRGTVNELGFRLFAESLVEDASVDALAPATVQRCIEATLEYVFGAQAGAERIALAMDGAEVQEAGVLAKRLLVFFYKIDATKPAPFPLFRGCGWLDECVGDVLSAEALFEVKAGGRNFRGIDVRQVLVYCALNFASGAYDIPRICLVNPRMGVFLDERIDRLCGELAGRPASDVLADIVQFVSDPRDGYIGA